MQFVGLRMRVLAGLCKHRILPEAAAEALLTRRERVSGPPATTNCHHLLDTGLCPTRHQVDVCQRAACVRTPPTGSEVLGKQQPHAS